MRKPAPGLSGAGLSKMETAKRGSPFLTPDHAPDNQVTERSLTLGYLREIWWRRWRDGHRWPAERGVDRRGQAMRLHVPRENLDFAVVNGRYLTPIYQAVRDFGCGLLVVPQGVGRFDPPPAGRSTIILLGDDLAEALGPAAFHEPSLRRSLKGVRLAAIVACEPLPEIYASAASHAVLLRKNVVIAETQPEQEIQWVKLIREIAPDTAFLLGSVKGGTA